MRQLTPAIAGRLMASGARLEPGRRWRAPLLLLAPVLVVYIFLLLFPLATVLEESFRAYIPGRVGSVAGAPYTLENYAEFLKPSYTSFFWTTARLSTIAALLCAFLALPIAYLISRAKSILIRKGLLVTMIIMIFLSALVRIYAIQLTFGLTGLFPLLVSPFGLRPSSRLYLEMTIVAGLLHFMLPIATLTLLGAIKNVNANLIEAAQSLGASRSWAHLTVTLPLSAPGLIGAFLITFCGSLSAFVVPLILGKGRVLFISNLIYNRFSGVANYPSGAALSILMLLLALGLVFLATRASSRYGQTT